MKPFFNDPVFRQFFGDQVGQGQQGRPEREQSLGSGVIITSGRNDPDEQSRDRWRIGHQSGLERQARIHGETDRHGSEDGCGRSED